MDRPRDYEWMSPKAGGGRALFIDFRGCLSLGGPSLGT